MWEDPDPGGTNIKAPSPHELSELKDQNEQQLVLIAQLKEMLRKDQSSVSQDKVEEYVNTLNRARAKRSKLKRGDSSSSSSSTTTGASIDANKKERVNLLRQQLEENKARLAERGKSQKGIEEMMTQLQAQLKDTAHSSTPLNMSLVETKPLDYNENTPQKELYNILLTKEKKITELLSKSQKLEGTVLDLQENLKEKDSVIDARTKAITLMTESLSKKGKNTLDALEETKEQMRKMQEHFVTLEAEMKARQLTLLNDLKVKNFEISELQEINGRLERDKSELEQQLSSPAEAVDSSEVENLRKEMEQLQLEKERCSILEKSESVLQNKYQEVCQENADNILKISQLMVQLEEASSVVDNPHSTTFEENKRLIEENLTLHKENSGHVENVHELEKQLQEMVSKLGEYEHANKDIIEEKERLSKENSELEKQLEDAVADLRLLKNTGMGGSATKSNKDGNDEELIVKLKKQLDESNKSMIKMRAVQKGKVKELNKRLDQFRKMGDANALIVQLQTDIGKLNEKIAELEDEKGNLQLKMVDSTSSSKEDYSDLEEEIKQLKENLNKTEQELVEKDKVIEILESDVLTLKAELKKKSEEEIKVSTQVSSEMSSICYEEQIEALESVKHQLIEQLSTLHAEKETLLHELEVAKKETQDLHAKLDSYIQENMDLIDKLEKLSAEKVSSAESIEIVEGLTQQEKLELAAYQKHINPEGTIKCPDDDTVEPPAELNESVLQLSEDTAELLQKIEMFTQERKEVMQKMEDLKEENNMLSLKVQEIENNRDVLEETYEQLQNEKDALFNEKQELSRTLEQRELLEKEEERSANVLDSELKNLQIKYEALIQENNELKRTLKEFDSIVQEKYDLESRLREVVDNNTSLDTKLNSNLDEINAYQLTIEDNKTDLTNSAEIISRLQSEIEERENDIKELHINISELNSVINELQGKQTSFDVMESELDNLKLTLTNQLTQASDYESEISQNSQTIKQLNEDLIGMNRRILELENELELKESEIEKLAKEISNKDEIIRNLQSYIEEKDQSFKVVSEDIKGKYLQLKEQLDGNDASLRKEISKLSSKNQEQLEKMKIIAANLKKKTRAYQELEEQYKQEKQYWETQDKEKNNNIDLLNQNVYSLKLALEESENRLRVTLDEIKALKEEVENLEQNNADQQHCIQELKHKQDKFQETSLQQEMSASLHEEIDSSFSQNVVPDDKIRELELLLETNESELSHYKERISKLEEDVRKLQDAKSQLEAINAELVEKLNLTSNSFKEKALLEDQLELRLAEITANDEALTKKLQESQSEREELLKKNQEHDILIKRLKIKLKKAHDKVTELQTVQSNVQDLETANQELRNQVASLEDNQRHIQNENESLQRRNLSDYDKIEADYQIQLEELLRAKNELATDNEKLLEKKKELEDREQELTSELDEYKIRVEQIEESYAQRINLLQSDLESKKIDNEKLLNELDELRLELQASTSQVDDLKKDLLNLNILEGQIDALETQNNNLIDSLKLSEENLEKNVIEANNLRLALQQSNEALQALAQEAEKSKQEILALEFAKASLEASYESTQKFQNNDEQVQPGEIPQQTTHDDAIPTFHWSDQSADVGALEQHKTDNILLKDFNDKCVQSVSDTEDLKAQLDESKRELQLTRDEANNLRAEIERLKLDIHALQFAKASLEASYDSSQKPADTIPPNQNSSVTLEDVSRKIIAKSDQLQPSAVPLFNAFAPPTTISSSLFDSFATATTSNNAEDWFSQSVEPTPVSAASQIQDAHMDIDLMDSNNTRSGQTAQLDDGREALLKKIKALEFLLYNTDKEKEIALDQCTEMVHELTRMFYDKSSAPKRKSDVESQIMSEKAIADMSADKEALRQAEYAPINKNYGEQESPVDEDIVQPKQAYICFDDDEPPKVDGDNTTKTVGLESQIISDKDVAEASTSKKALQALEFERVDESLGEQQQPVVEPLAQPKHAYLCYTKDDKPQSLEAFEENDDGWAWGPEEARLEEEHISTLENIPQVKTLLLEIQQLKENIRVLQVERENHLEEIKQLQIKSGKLIKKCKELKAKSEQDKKPDDGGFFDLNETIQDEFKAQVQQLEKKLKDLTAEHGKDKAEKDNLLKRVDVLTAANERMMEMKEVQDSEVFRWQRKHKEALEKLKQYEFGSDGFVATQEHLTTDTSPRSIVDQSTKIKELEDSIKDLSLDNEELQALLEEATAKRLEAEKNKSSGNEGELAEMRSLNETLHKELDIAKTTTDELRAQLNGVLIEKEQMFNEKVALESCIEHKEVFLQELQKNVDMLTNTKEQQLRLNENEMQGLKEQIAANQRLLQEKELIIDDLQSTLDQLTNRKAELDLIIAQLHNDLSLKAEEIQQLQSSLEKNVSDHLEEEKRKSQIEYLNLAVQEREETIVGLNTTIDQLTREKNVSESNQEQLNYKLHSREEEARKVLAEKEQRDVEYQNTLHDLQAKILEVQEGQSLISDLQGRISELEAFGLEKIQKENERRSLVEQLEIRSLELEEKQRLLDELQLKVTESNQAVANTNELLNELDKKAKEIAQLTSEKLIKDSEIQRLLTEAQNKEQQFQERVNTLVNELNENWQLQVDQRGADVAESWKMHLEMVEKDNASVQDKLKADLLELEEKCNILVNENNELRKNVDQEISNEVDKISALQQQLSNLQQTVSSLNQLIQEKDKQIEEIQNNLSNYLSLENELKILRTENLEKENKLASINIIIETTQKQFDEKREVVEEIVSVLEKHALSPISYEKDDILREFQRQLRLGDGKDIEIVKLNESLHALEETSKRVSGEKNREITGLNQVIEDLEKDLSVIHEKEAEIVRLNTELKNIQLEKEALTQNFNACKQELENIDHDHSIHEKEAEIVRLNTELNNIQLEKEALTQNFNGCKQELENIKHDHSNCFKTIEDCNRQVQEYYNAHLSLQQSLDDKNKEIVDLNRQLVELQRRAKDDSNKQIESLNESLGEAKDGYLVLQASLSECQNQLYEATQQLAQKSQELQTANQNIAQYQQSNSYFEEESNRLTELLDHREKEYNNSLEMLKNNQLADVQRHYDELLSNRDLDISTLRGQVQEVVNANQSYTDKLNEELAHKQQLEQRLRQQTQLVDEDTKQLEELKLIIEDQVAKIEELKQELFDKSNRYDSLIAEMDVGRAPVTRQPSAAVNPPSEVQRRHYIDEDLSEPVSRAELDLSLYMLHQRDVRCEELTVELTQLLEERDTLQLRLSNAIREKEELRRSIAGSSSPMPTTSSSTGVNNNTPQGKSSAIFLAASGIELAKDPLEGQHNLATKLSELKNVGYKKDKTFVDEQEARRFQQLAIMQQHINEASRLPPEAAAKLVDASYTLSRDVQSPSKVLLNWLWGKNPPKASDS